MSENSLLDAALDYGTRGWPVFPVHGVKTNGWCTCGKADCKNIGKHPREKGGFQTATTDADVIKRWWSRWPNSNIGIATGEVSGLYVVDVDPRDGGDARLAQLQAEWGDLPATLRAKTGGGGDHYFFAHSHALGCSTGKNGGILGAGLDTKGHGGYVVAPPSRHRSGGVYAWCAGTGPGTVVAPVPQFIIDLEQARQAEATLAAAIQHEVKKRAGPGAEAFDEAVRKYNLENRREYPSEGTTCPMCEGRSGFKAHGKISGRWACWNPDHTVGKKGNGHHYGDALDIDAHQRGRSRKEHLKAEGYWTPPTRKERFLRESEARLDSAPAAAGETTSQAAGSAPQADAGPLARTFASLCKIFETPKLAAPVLAGRVLAFNEMTGEICLNGTPLSDDDVNNMRRRIELAHCDEEGFALTFNDLECWKALSLASKAKRFHPVRDYLRSLKWDGVPRIESVPEDLLDAAGTPAQRVVFKRYLISAVARAMRPGCKADCMVVLFGKQGMKKGTFWRVLASDAFFSDTSMDLHSKDAYLQLRGVWIYEWAELHAMSGARDIEVVKGFITSQEDRYRPPYGRAPVSIPRSCVFAGSTNHKAFLSDPTGNRRFWPIEVGEINLDLTAQWRDQLWAEAVALFDAKEQWHLTEAEEQLLVPVHDEHRHRDAWEGSIEEFLERHGLDFVSTEQLLEAALQKPKALWTDGDTKRIGKIMSALGFESDRRRVGDARVRGWSRRSTGPSVAHVGGPGGPEVGREFDNRDA